MCARCVCDVVSLLVQRNEIPIRTHTQFKLFTGLENVVAMNLIERR